MDNKQNAGFQYTYSAKEQDELKRIREKYTAKEESSLDRLRRLDAGVTKKALTVSLIVGIIGVLCLGAGMSLIMSDFGKILGEAGGLALPLGIGLGLLGGTVAALAYPLHNFVIKREREKIAPEILRLSDELMK